MCVDARGDGIEFRLCLGEGDAATELADGGKEVVAALVHHHRGRLEGKPDACVDFGTEALRVMESGGHDADDGMGFAGDVDFAAEDVGIGVEALAPDAFREQDDLRTVGQALFGVECSTEEWCCAEHRKGIDGEMGGLHAFQAVTVVEDGEVFRVAGDVAE